MNDPLEADAAVVVVGASLAGLRAAEEIRHERHAGPVIVIGDEIHPPYDRPPLSKQFLAGKWGVDRIHHHAPDKLDTLDIEFELGRRVSGLDTDTRTLTFADGDTLTYGGLVVATGARARALSGTEEVEAVHTLRTLDDCLAIRSRLERTGRDARVVVIGADTDLATLEPSASPSVGKTTNREVQGFCTICCKRRICHLCVASAC